MTDFFRFPHTPHIAWLAQGAPRDGEHWSRRRIAWNRLDWTAAPAS